MHRLVKLFLVVLSLIVLYWPGVKYHWETTKDPHFAPYDAVQYIPSFFRFDPTDPIPTTYAKEYYLNAVYPLLYKWLTIAGAQFVDVRHFQLAMTYFMYAVFLVVVGRLGWLWGGGALCFAVLAITLSAWIFFGLGFIGGAPRMYAFPLISLVVYSLFRDRPYVLALLVVLGGLLYPIVGLIGGLCLASWMSLRCLQANGVVSRWSASHRFMILGLSGFLTIAAVVPLMLGSAPYGRRVVDADIVVYPEAGPDGNYRSYDQLPYKLFGGEWTAYFVGPLYSHGDPLVSWLNLHQNLDPVTLLFVLVLTGLIVVVVIIRGVKLYLEQDSTGAGIRLVSFFVICVILHIGAWLAAPYLYIPTRYFMFSLPFLITLIFPWTLYVTLGRVSQLQSSPKLHKAIFLGVIGVYLVAFAGRGNVEFSSSAPEEKPARALFDMIATLPNDVVIAGWPVGQIRRMEYLTRRNAFLTGNIHEVLYLDFMKVMRNRMDALFDAYLSTDSAPLYRLKQEFGVTHLLVETRDFTDLQHPPEYFAPWRARIGPRLAEIKGKEYLMSRSLHEKAAVFNQKGFILLDLARLP